MSDETKGKNEVTTSWRRLASRKVLDNRWMEVHIDKVALPDGRTYDYTVIRRNADGVAAMLFDDENRVLLEREYRYPVNEIIWQLPGGLVDPGEALLPAIQRELAEETGYVAQKWEYLGHFWDNPAFSAMKVHIFLARNAHQSAATHFDEAEFVVAEWRDWEWLKAAVRSGEIKERVLLSALGMLMARGRC